MRSGTWSTLCVTFILLGSAGPSVLSQSVEQRKPLPGGNMNPNLAYHYEPVAGKTVGLWPVDFSVESLTQMRLWYGFSGVVAGPDRSVYDNLLAAGFLPSEILILIWEDSYVYAVDSLPAAIYYLDEAVEHDCYGHPTVSRIYTPSELAARRDYVHSHRPGAKFVIGGYKQCSHYQIASAYADNVMYSSYMNWDEIHIPLCHVNLGWGDEYENPWLPGDSDQRTSWTSMRNVFGAQFAFTWIHGGGDEYALLFPHANTLGLTGLWMFNGAPIDSANLEFLCYTAWQNGWLNRVDGSPLAVELTSFTATREATTQHVLLEWATLSEINNYGFEVQCREEADTSFVTIPDGFVPGHGTTLEPQQYSHVDTSAPPGALTYRLKQIDYDGSIHYSDEVLVNVATSVDEGRLHPEITLYQNYPNPFNPSTTIRFSLARNQFVTLNIYDVLGTNVSSLLSARMEAGEHTIRWDAENIAGGVYFCQLRAGSFVETKKLILLH